MDRGWTLRWNPCWALIQAGRAMAPGLAGTCRFQCPRLHGRRADERTHAAHVNVGFYVHARAAGSPNPQTLPFFAGL